LSRKEELEQSIIDQCLNPDGLPTLLRDNWLDEEKYNNLMSAIREYHQLTKDEPVLNRRVAGSLRVFELQLEGAVIYHQRVKSTAAYVQKIYDANSEVWDLMNEIFDIRDS
jgi:hypothetical protein